MAGLILPFKGITPKIHRDAFIAENAVIIGDVEIGPGASIWYGCVVRGDVNRIRIGANTNLQDGTVVHCNHDPNGDYRETGGGMPTLIGDNVVIGHMALIHACTLESDCFIGMRAVVMDKAVVESGAMVAAGAACGPDGRSARRLLRFCRIRAVQRRPAGRRLRVRAADHWSTHRHAGIGGPVDLRRTRPTRASPRGAALTTSA